MVASSQFFYFLVFFKQNFSTFLSKQNLCNIGPYWFFFIKDTFKSMSIVKPTKLQIIFRVKNSLLTKTFSKLKQCIKTLSKLPVVKIVLLKKYWYSKCVPISSHLLFNIFFLPIHYHLLLFWHCLFIVKLNF